MIKTAEERYLENITKQQKALDDYARHEREWVGNLLLWYKPENGKFPMMNTGPPPAAERAGRPAEARITATTTTK
jgi:hypothetical protein